MSAATPAPDLGAAILDELRLIRQALERSGVNAPRVARDPDQLLGVREAAVEVGVDVKSLRAAIALGKVPSSNPGKRMTRVRRGDVVAWLSGRGRGKRGAA